MKKIKLRLERIKRGHKLEMKRDYQNGDEKARDQIRKFVLDEFMRKDPDQISFERPDSGSGVFSDEDESQQTEDEEDWFSENDDIMDDLNKKDLDRKSRAAKSRRSRRSATSKASGGSHKTNKTSKTAKSKASKLSQRTSKSRAVRRSSSKGQRSQGGFTDGGGSAISRDEDIDWGQREENNPHSRVIQKRFLSGFKKNKVYIESLKVTDLKSINFEAGGIPRFACDLFKYITLIDIEDYYAKKRARLRREQRAMRIFGDISRADEFDSSSDELDTEFQKIQKDINDWQNSLGPKLFKKIFACFTALSKNQDDTEKQSCLYVTEGSFIKNFPKQFGYKSEFLIGRFYYLMTGKQPGVKVYFPQYMAIIAPLFQPDILLQQRFVFNLYDYDCDGTLSSHDIVEVQKHVDPSSVLGEELEILAQHQVNTRILSTLQRDNDILTPFTFNQLIYRSCLIDELKQRLASKPNKDWTFSVFQGRDPAIEQQRTKKGVQKNLRLYRPAKKVRWNGLPPVEEDGKKERKVMKDAPNWKQY